MSWGVIFMSSQRQFVMFYSTCVLAFSSKVFFCEKLCGHLQLLLPRKAFELGKAGWEDNMCFFSYIFILKC